MFDEVQHVPGPLGSRALRFGLRATLLAPLGAAAAVTVFADENAKAGSFVPLVIAITILGIAVSFLPWDQMAGSAFGRRVLHAWAGLDLVLITLAGWSATGADLVLPLSYAVTIVFFAMVFPPRSQAVYLGAMLASYLVVQLSTDFELLPFVMLAILGGLSCFLSLELRRRTALHETARIEAERRWAVVGAVATTARAAEASNPVDVLQGIVDALAILGYDSAAIHVTDGDGRMRVFLPRDADDVEAAGVRSLTDEIRSAVLDDGRAIVATVADADRLTLQAMSASGLEALAAVPIVTGERPTGVLLAGTRARRGITAREMDTFSMLAGQAALAVVRAQRIAEERAVAERIGATDRANAEIVSRLSQEVRKPLAIVTETTSALRGSANGDRDRLLERLAAGATALDVTLGGLLDVSLLDAGEVPIDVREVDLGTLVPAVAGRMSGLFVDRELVLHAAEGFVVEADPALLERAVENLLVSAATSTPPGRAVEVSVTRTDGKTVVTMSGDGTIPPELLARIAEPFDPSGGVAGPVVRLALAAKILELHGTVLEVTSEPGHGTRVWFRLPGHRAPGRTAGAAVPFLTEPDDPFVENAVPVAAAARAAFAMPPPPVEDDEDRERPPGHLGAAAAALATVASTMIVTGVVPDLVQQPHPVSTSVPENGGKQASHDEGSKKKHPANENGKAPNGSNGGSKSANGSGSSTGTGSMSGSGSTGTGGSTGDTSGTGGGDTGGGGGGGGTGSGTPAPTPAPSPAPSPSPSDGPGKSEDAPGHNKSPSPSP